MGRRDDWMNMPCLMAEKSLAISKEPVRQIKSHLWSTGKRVGAFASVNRHSARSAGLK
jgi:hypothetical protein